MKEYYINKLYIGIFDEIVNTGNDYTLSKKKYYTYPAEDIKIITILENITDEYKYMDVLTKEKFKNNTTNGGELNELILKKMIPLSATMHLRTLNRKKIRLVLEVENDKWHSYRSLIIPGETKEKYPDEDVLRYADAIGENPNANYNKPHILAKIYHFPNKK